MSKRKRRPAPEPYPRVFIRHEAKLYAEGLLAACTAHGSPLSMKQVINHVGVVPFPRLWSLFVVNACAFPEQDPWPLVGLLLVEQRVVELRVVFDNGQHLRCVGAVVPESVCWFAESRLAFRALCTADLVF